MWAQITDYDYRQQVYTLYFPDNGQVKESVCEKDIKPLVSSNPPPTRSQMINKTFFCDGDEDLAAGRWKVRGVIKVNEFRCTRLSGEGSKNVEDFDIGWVTNTFMKEQSNNRERGVFEPVVGKRRRSSRGFVSSDF